MRDRATTDGAEGLTRRALEIARTAWREAHRGLPNPPMTRSADVIAVAAIAASLLARLDDRAAGAEAPELAAEAGEAIRVARAVAQQLGEPAPGNPMMRAAEKSAVGILAAGLLNRR
jgi:hypothetical protein